MGKTQEALELMRQNPGMTPYGAAKQIGIAAPTVYRARVREQKKQGFVPCPCCGMMVDPKKLLTPDSKTG